MSVSFKPITEVINMLPNIPEILFKAAVGIGERLVYDFIKEKQAQISERELKKRINEEVSKESQKIKLDEDQLRQVTETLTEQIVARMQGFEKEGTFYLNRGTPEKSKQMIEDLTNTVNSLENEYNQSKSVFLNEEINETSNYGSKAICNLKDRIAKINEAKKYE